MIYLFYLKLYSKIYLFYLKLYSKIYLQDIDEIISQISEITEMLLHFVIATFW